MDGPTRRYLEGRFRDHYRASPVPTPPAARDREWGHIPFTEGGTTMVRHRSLVEIGSLSEFLARVGPRHVYFSAATYDDPGARPMAEKGWRGADLVFDLDADHLPGVDPESTPYAEMLAACKEALERLLDLLTEDFGVADPTVVFSGGRGYHVHVRAPSVRDLDSAARREVVDYVRGADLDRETLVTTRAVDGTPRRSLRTEGGWGRRVHRRLVAFAEEAASDPEAARERLTDLDGIGERRAETVLGAFESTPDAIRAGNLEAGGPGLRTLVDALIEETVASERAPIDEPVTTDTNRLIRLPGSLHGGTGLAVCRLDPDALDGFDPLVDAVPERFLGQRVRIEVTEPGAEPVTVAGEAFTPTAGEHTVGEPVAVFLMARGRARKLPEPDPPGDDGEPAAAGDRRGN